MTVPMLNLWLGWIWILAGFIAGAVIGLFFHRDDWLGGYNAFPRRLVRLGHIAFFGTAIINLLFAFTVGVFGLGAGVRAASWAFAGGAFAMPLCCFYVAARPRAHMLFSVPVLLLITGGVLTLWGLAAP